MTIKRTKKKLKPYAAYVDSKWTKREKEFYRLGWSHGYSKRADEIRKILDIRIKDYDG